ncbi:response regulator [Algibacillus agarilyticus]|uniref:response regulator n=1 Tax=Algibacillus agarilyticus TaxID=2234133 RepID=UPI000DCF6CFB|nr:response regulator [Algibacillus agarilyticus]
MEKQNLKNFASLNVLIIDEQTLVHHTLKNALLDLGITHIKCAENAFYGLRLCEEELFHVVICSFNVKSDRDGFHLLEEMKFKGFVTKCTVLIFLSADTEESLVNSIAELQPDDFWVKPLTLQRITTRLVQTIDIKQTLYNVYYAMDIKEYSKAIYFIERHFLNPKLKRYFLNLQRLKGECLLKLREFVEAENYYRELLVECKQSWVHLGFVTALIKQNKIEEIHQLLDTLRDRVDTRFATFDLLAQYHIDREEYVLAYEQMQNAVRLSPRNIERNKKYWDLARLNQDHEGQYKATRAMAQNAKNSIHDSPEHLLNVVRSGIDFASTLSSELSKKVIRQVEVSFSELEKSTFDLNMLKEQMLVVKARIHNVKDEREYAERIVENHVNLKAKSSIEDNLDKVKVFHELGLREEALLLLDAVKNQINGENLAGQVVTRYIEQESEQRGEIHFTAKQLNNMAFEFFKRNRYDSAVQALTQALQLTPRSARTMLSLLKVLVAVKRKDGLALDQRSLASDTLETLKVATLTPKQSQVFDALLHELDVEPS